MSNDLFREIHSSRGMQFINRMHYRSFTLNIFRGNARKLIEALKQAEDVDFALRTMNEGNREIGHQVFREISRLFHNFLAAAMTIVDHTRIFMEQYLGQEPNKYYRDVVKAEFLANGLTRFVQDLRNYMLHKGLPPAQRHITFTQSKFATGVRLDVKELSLWDGWKKESKAFLKNNEGYLDLLPLVREYTTLIEDFQERIDGKLMEYHQNDLDILNALHEDLKKERIPKAEEADHLDK